MCQSDTFGIRNVNRIKLERIIRLDSIVGGKFEFQMGSRFRSGVKGFSFSERNRPGANFKHRLGKAFSDTEVKKGVHVL